MYFYWSPVSNQGRVPMVVQRIHCDNEENILCRPNLRNIHLYNLIVQPLFRSPIWVPWVRLAHGIWWGGLGQPKWKPEVVQPAVQSFDPVIGGSNRVVTLNLIFGSGRTFCESVCTSLIAGSTQHVAWHWNADTAPPLYGLTQANALNYYRYWPSVPYAFRQMTLVSL